VWTVAGVAAAAGLVTALMLTLPTDSGNDTPEGKGGGTVTATSTPSPSQPSPTPSPSAPSPSAAGPPAGYTLHDDVQGFHIAVPEGWQRTSRPAQYGMDIVNYRSPGGDRRLQVYQVKEASPDESFEEFLSPATSKADGFRELSLDNLDTSDFTGSRLEYLADTLKGEPDIGTWHVVDERFLAADGLRYALASYGPDADGREDERKILSTALEWFCPPSTTCDADAGLD
jgi:hypothetical protein